VGSYKLDIVLHLQGFTFISISQIQFQVLRLKVFKLPEPCKNQNGLVRGWGCRNLI